jgi:hypothetical protein
VSRASRLADATAVAPAEVAAVVTAAAVMAACIAKASLPRSHRIDKATTLNAMSSAQTSIQP